MSRREQANKGKKKYSSITNSYFECPECGYSVINRYLLKEHLYIKHNYTDSEARKFAEKAIEF